MPLPPAEAEDTMLFVCDGRTFVRSDAVLKIAQVLGFPWSLGCIGKCIPCGWRDFIYRWIARNRYRWFGMAHHCQLFSGEEQNRLLP